MKKNIVIVILSLVCIAFLMYAYIQKMEAEKQRILAEVSRNEADLQRNLAIQNEREAIKLRELCDRTAEELRIANKALQDALAASKKSRRR